MVPIILSTWFIFQIVDLNVHLDGEIYIRKEIFFPVVAVI